MTLFIIILIVATAGVAFITFNDNLSKNKLIKYGSYIVYFIIIEIILYAVTDGIEIPLIVLGVGIGVVLIILLIAGSFLASANNKTVKYLLSVIFIALAFYAGYVLYESIMTPIRFNTVKKQRYQATVNALKRVRTAQIAFKNENGKYTKYLDSLKNFIEHDSLTVIRREGSVPDTIYLQQGNNLKKAERECIRLGIKGFVRDTIKVAIADTLYKNYDFKKFGIVPYTDGYKFEMDTATVNTGGMSINVFEAKVPNDILLKGLNRELILNLNDDAIKNDRYPGLKIGSLTENNNNEGNWDKEYDLKK
ncbi:MAG: hypothetical protein L3J56_05090 [Bacteroidales bacterium]|nr:hypothetical protein [Bacteroidales bacterium]